MHNKVKVVLPRRLFDEAGDDKTKLKQLIVEYMKRSYPNYTILKVTGNLAVCEMGR